MIIFDIEIKRAILNRGQSPVPGIEYCEGWRDFRGMGIACLCTMELGTGLSQVFFEEDVDLALRYLASQGTCGWNSERFDLPVLAAACQVDAPPVNTPHIDLVKEILLAQGKSTLAVASGWNLADVASATLQRQKITTGADMPTLWQRGQRSAVINHCLTDVSLTCDLLRFARVHGYLQRPDKGPQDDSVVHIPGHRL